MKIKLNIDRVRCQDKPQKKEIGAISNRTRQASGQKEIEASELVYYFKNGYTITPGLIGGTQEEHKARQARHDTNLRPYWQGQQIICADIDNECKNKRVKYELTPKTALDACKVAGIDPYCIYKTFSYTPEHEKYRVVIVLEEPITDFDTAQDLIGRFNNLFDDALANTYKVLGEDPETCADTSIEPVKLIFGGREDCIIYESLESITPIDKLRALPKAPANGPKNASKGKTGNNTPKPKQAKTGYTDGQNERDLIISALFAIDPASLKYEDWRDIGMALKYEGIDYATFDQWSAQDTGTNDKGKPRYNEEANYKSWLAFGEPGQDRGPKTVKAGTIFHFAKLSGWKFPEPKTIYGSQEWQKIIESFDNAPIHESYPPDFIPDEPTTPAEPGNEEPENPAEDPNNQKSIEDNMPPEKGHNNDQQAPAPAPIMSASDYLMSGYDADIDEIQMYAGRKLGLEHPDIDRYLTLYPGLAVLGGQASLGKTTFCVNVASKLLEKGEHVLYFALEQRPVEIITKVVTRYICEQYPEANITNIMLNNGLRNATITRAKEELKDKLKNLYVIECDFETTAKSIINQVIKYKNENNINPVVIVDYLQLIAPPVDFRGDTRACVDENLKALKKMQKENKLFVLVVSSFNRASNYEPISYESFKETGMIESTCDYVFGLQLTIQDANNDNFYLTKGANGLKERPNHEKKNLIQQEQAKYTKKVQFVSLKNRGGKQFFTACFDYFPCFDLYQVDEIGIDAYLMHKTPKANNKPTK